LENSKFIETLEKCLLLIVPLGLSIIGCGYLLNPLFYPNVFGFYFDNINGMHVYRAFGALYLSMSCYWLLSLKNKSWRKGAILSIAFLMAGLLVGRFISLIVEGIPHSLLILFIGLEILCLVQALVVLKYKYSNTN